MFDTLSSRYHIKKHILTIALETKLQPTIQMKKALYTFALALLSLGIQAQCTPDTSIKTPGIYPSQLPHSIEDSMYNEVLQFKLPKDTNVGVTIPFDSFVIVKIINLPSFISYKCSSQTGMSDCAWKGGSNSCLTFTGKPPVGSAGKYKLKVHLKAYYVLFGNPTFTEDSNLFTRDFFVDAAPNGVQDVFNNAYHTSAQPNPFDQYTDIPFMANQNGLVTARVFDCQGKEVMTKQQAAEVGKNAVRIDGKNLPNGVYHVAVTFGGQSGFVRIVRL